MQISASASGEDEYSFGDIDSHITEEFTTEFHEAYDRIEAILLQLEKIPGNDALLNDLFRHVHTVKGNLQLIGLDPIADFVHALENILDKIRKHTLSFDRQLSDVVLLSMDLTREMCDTVFARKPLNTTLARQIQNELLKIVNGNQNVMSIHAINILNILDPNLVEHNTVDLTEDLRFIANLAEYMETRSPFWAGRTKRILQIARDINEQSGYCVDQKQLDAAVYTHDIGMAFMSLDILHKSDKLSRAEYEKIKSHPVVGARLMGRMSGWESAEQIILQHHEREDGTGYPNKTPGKDICDGAKILSIADTFEAMTQQRADRVYKRPLLRAISEINNCAESQFSQKWVDIFNDAIRSKKIQRNTH